MHLTKSHAGSSSSPGCGSLDPSKLERLALACRSTSKELQRSLSISSDSSVPRMMDNHFGLSTSESDISIENFLASEALDTDAIWDIWFSPKEEPSSLRSPFYVDSTPLLPKF
ncbi:hypothetical protein G7Y89_g8067 [Cudoniella acicularis]|uniref:Uncharacterized protein n=1 Tax=Cudoniella acicularis TaxID=354080 RepID=A0A8H4RH80_9HELO|nr:hypothetical protein G7Y89_g8067 [Cudoniella acicularis]